jgi:uncharacterized membrane protein
MRPATAHQASTKGRRKRERKAAAQESQPGSAPAHQERRKSMENRVADQITRFAGSMRFVYIHIIWFAAWICFRVEPYPFGLLTMIVSLEVILLSTYVMISQSRAEEKRQVLADHQWQTVQQEEQQNEELLHISSTQ